MDGRAPMRVGESLQGAVDIVDIVARRSRHGILDSIASVPANAKKLQNALGPLHFTRDFQFTPTPISVDGLKGINRAKLDAVANCRENIGIAIISSPFRDQRLDSMRGPPDAMGRARDWCLSECGRCWDVRD
jgi:hypothetical protein